MSKVITVRLDDELHRRVRIRLAEDGSSFQQKLESYLRAYADGARPADLHKRLKSVQARIRSYVPADVSLVDELIADRRREAAREQERR
jgi:plasmid stability protein